MRKRIPANAALVGIFTVATASGARNGKPFDYKLWFSDMYARTPAGWRYVFGQASLPLPPGP